MPWVIGLDEAGYGPNLGPLLQAAAAVRLPIDELAGWTVLSKAIRKAGGRADRDERLVVDDSKKVYHGTTALERLERGVLAFFGGRHATLDAWLESLLSIEQHEALRRESWYAGDKPLPLAIRPHIRERAVEFLNFRWAPGTAAGPLHAKLTCPTEFNEAVDASGSKATILTAGTIELLRLSLLTLPNDEDSVLILCDKHGGRNYYGAMLKETFPFGIVRAEVEAAHESRYRVEGLGRAVQVVFRPRADGDCIAVALASMVCKYLREVCMDQFTAFWARHVPDIAPTAGYPVDAKRFMDDIRTALPRTGIAERQLWRSK